MMGQGGIAKVICPVCGTDYGNLVTACPKCGAMNTSHRAGPSNAAPPQHAAQPAHYAPPPPAPAYPAQYPAYQQQPAYPQQYPPGYGYPQPQPQGPSPLGIIGTLCALGAFISMLIGGMALQAICGVSALVLGVIGLIIGIMLIRKQPAQAKLIISFSTIAIVATIIIVVMAIAILG